MSFAINTHEEYLAAKRELAGNERPEPGTKAFERHNYLVDAIVSWEAFLDVDNDPVDPIDVITAFMLDEDKTQADLGRLFNSESRASEIMNKRRRLTVQMVYLLNREWKIPAELLIHPYDLAAPKRAA